MTVKELARYCISWDIDGKKPLYTMYSTNMISQAVHDHIRKFRKENSNLYDTLFYLMLELLNGSIIFIHPVEYQINRITFNDEYHSIKISGIVKYNDVFGWNDVRNSITIPQEAYDSCFQSYTNTADYSSLYEFDQQHKFINNLFKTYDDCCRECDKQNEGFSQRVHHMTRAYNILQHVIGHV